MVAGRAALLLIGAGTYIVLQARHIPPTPSSMDPAITASLASQGITLSAPPTTSFPITREQAVAIASEGVLKHKTVSSAVLAKVIVQPNAAFNCTCWVVTWLLGPGLPLPGGPPGRKPSASEFQSWMRYHVAFVDAQSGKWDFTVESYIPFQPSPTASS
jgi:hypothetical protein